MSSGDQDNSKNPSAAPPAVAGDSVPSNAPADIESTQRLLDQLSDVRMQLEDTRGKLEEMRQQAMLDPLTGIGNRRSLMMVLDRRFSELYRYSSGFSMLAIDFDLLKSINDTHGHPAGDAILIGTTQRIIADLRQADRLFRLGGDEFVALLPATPLEGAILTADRLCVAVAENQVCYRDLVLSMTVSIGVAEATKNDDPNSLLERADGYLYQAKSLGGNQIGTKPTATDSSRD